MTKHVRAIIAFSLVFALPLSSLAQTAERFVCTSGDLIRRVAVENPTGGQLPCEVAYYKDSEASGVREVLWSAGNDAQYCSARTAELLDRLEGFGWQCTADSDAVARTTRSGLAPITVAGGMWIELSPVVVAANNFYPDQVPVSTGGVRSLTSGEALIATNAETQLLRESVDNPDLRIIMTVTESFYRLVGKRSAGIETLADLEGKRVIVPYSTSANYFLVAMLESVGLTEDDVTLVPFPSGPSIIEAMDMMSDAVVNGEADVVAIWEPEAEDTIHDLGDDAIVFQERDVYREVFNLHTTATTLNDPALRPAVVEFVRAIVAATEALEENPEPYWQEVSDLIGYPVSDIEASWGEMEFPIQIVPDMLDVLVKEEAWVAQERDREPRSREELARLIDYSVLEEALADR